MVQRFKVFAKLQTAQDYETLVEGLLCELHFIPKCLAFAELLDEHNLRKRITELQEYRRMGITTAQEAEVYETAKAARVSALYCVGFKLTCRPGTAHSSPVWMSCPLALEQTLVSIASCMESRERQHPSMVIVVRSRLAYLVSLVVNPVSCLFMWMF